jgi:exodeoxyribonuclease VII large subunit
MDGVNLRGRRLDELSLRLASAEKGLLRDRRAALGAAAGKLESLSPLAVLGRGYSLTYSADDGRLISSAETARIGQRLLTRFQHGSATSLVERIEPPKIE